MEYNVIWIDDEWDSRGKPFIQMCEVKHKIHITPFKTRKEGIDMLEKNLSSWDAVILDAKAYDESENEVADVYGLYKAIKQLERLQLKKSIPYFVLTRQPDLMDDKTFESSVGKFYKKDPKGQEQLIIDLKEAVGLSPRVHIKHQYFEAIEQLSRLDFWSSEKLLDILVAMHCPEKEIDPLLYYNPLRKILEYLFRSANKNSIIPDELIGKDKDDVNLNQCVQYLSGRPAKQVGIIKDGEGKESVIPTHIQDMLFMVLKLGNVNSHSTALNDYELEKLGKYFESNVCNSRYIIFGLAMNICEIVLYLTKYIENNNDHDKNLARCKTFGVVELLNENSPICIIRSKRPGRESNTCVLAKYVKEKELIGKTVVIIEEEANNNPQTRNQYPYLAKKIQSLEK